MGLQEWMDHQQECSILPWVCPLILLPWRPSGNPKWYDGSWWFAHLCNPLSWCFLGDCERILDRTNHITLDSLKASMVAGFADIESFRESQKLLGTCWWSATPSNPLGYFFLKTCKRIINRTHHNTSNFLNASLGAPFMDIITAPGARMKVGSPRSSTTLESYASLNQRVASSN